MIIHLVHTCSAFDYLSKIEVEKYKSTVSLSGIVITYNKKSLIIPLANIAAIEEE